MPYTWNIILWITYTSLKKKDGLWIRILKNSSPMSDFCPTDSLLPEYLLTFTETSFSKNLEGFVTKRQSKMVWHNLSPERAHRLLCYINVTGQKNMNMGYSWVDWLFLIGCFSLWGLHLPTRYHGPAAPSLGRSPILLPVFLCGCDACLANGIWAGVTDATSEQKLSEPLCGSVITFSLCCENACLTY